MRHRFSKPYDEGAQLTAVLGLVAYVHKGILGTERAYLPGVIGVSAAGHFHQFTMQMQDVCTASPFVQVVHILCDDIHLVSHLFQLSHQQMPLAWLGSKQFLTPCVVEVRHKGRVAHPSLRGGHIVHIISVP